MTTFTPFPKMARWSRDVIVTEKLDGTNAQIYIEQLPHSGEAPLGALATSELGLWMAAGSRTRWIDVTDDNYGFAAWAKHNASELFKLGAGQHFGEWWGRGIQRNYSLPERRFSLFNVTRWPDGARPDCCGVVPALYHGPNVPGLAEREIRKLKENGSFAAPGFMNPEGIVIWHTAAQVGFKKTIDKDESPKGLA